MKIKKKSIIIPAFALLIGASLAGSISGTVAWYQYSTRVNAAFVGTSVGASGNLQMRFADESTDEDAWRSRLTIEEIAAKLNGNYASQLTPITTGDIDKDAYLAMDTNGNPVFYANPVYGEEDPDDWAKATAANYAKISLQLRYVDRDGVLGQNGLDPENIAKDIYLSDLLIQDDPNNEKDDLSDALRVHICTYRSDEQDVESNSKNFLISKSPAFLPARREHAAAMPNRTAKKAATAAQSHEFKSIFPSIALPFYTMRPSVGQ